MVPLLAHALERAQIDAPVTNALSRLISGELPLDEWVAGVRATVPPRPASDRSVAWARWRQRTKARFSRRQSRLLETFVEWRPPWSPMSRLSNLFYVLLGAVAVGVVVAVLAVVGALPDKVERTTVNPPDDGRRTAVHLPGLARLRAHERRRHLPAGLRQRGLRLRPRRRRRAPLRRAGRRQGRVRLGLRHRHGGPHRHQRPRRRGRRQVHRPLRRGGRPDPGQARRQGPLERPRRALDRPEGRQGRRQAAPARLLEVPAPG